VPAFFEVSGIES